MDVASLGWVGEEVPKLRCASVAQHCSAARGKDGAEFEGSARPGRMADEIDPSV